jgi:hypothetical protein
MSRGRGRLQDQTREKSVIDRIECRYLEAVVDGGSGDIDEDINVQYCGRVWLLSVKEGSAWR